MIVQPVPVGQASPVRRLLRIAGAVIPPALLVAVIGLGLTGARADDTPASPVPPAAAALDPAGSSPSPGPSLSPGPSTPGRATAVHRAFPRTLLGIPVRTVDEVLAGRGDGTVHGLVAIAGYLGLRELPETCNEPGLGPFGAFCARTGLLAGWPWEASTGYAELGRHLHPQFPVGVRVPHRVAEVARRGLASVPAVVIARFDDPRARRCMPVGRHCGEELVVERVAWIDGEAYPRTVTVDPDADPQPADRVKVRANARAAAAHLPDGSVPLLTALVRPGTMPWMDPRMSEVAASLEDGAVWYVRAVDDPLDPEAITWVVADVEGRALLSGELPILDGSHGG